MEVKEAKEKYSDSPSKNYQRYFVPVIGMPVANDLVDRANLKPGEQVLDIACGTGVVSRLASIHVGNAGHVVGTDINPEMISVARSASDTSPSPSIEWVEAPAEKLPLEDDKFDVVLCQLSLQFFDNQEAALNEMYRTTAPGGRVYINVPGRIAPMFEVLAEGMSNHFGDEMAGFVHKVFSLYDEEKVQRLLTEGGYRSVHVDTMQKRLHLPSPEKFLWQYIHSTPMAEAISGAEDIKLAALESEVVTKWSEFVQNGGMVYEQDLVYASGWKEG